MRTCQAQRHIFENCDNECSKCDDYKTIPHSITKTFDRPTISVDLGALDTVVEVDPNGKGAHEGGAKLDAGKIQVHLLQRFGLALMAVADLATLGAKKYSENGWATVPDGIPRYNDAMAGHWLREMFEEVDKDMQVPHEVQVVWNAMARLQLMIEADPEWKERLMSRKATQRKQDD